MGATELGQTAMTQYSRSVIPGRPQADDLGADVDRLIFGDAAPRATVRSRTERDIGQEADDIDEDDAPRLFKSEEFVERAKGERRKTRRRKSDYQPLAGAARRYGEPAESRRGPVLLVGAVVVVGVFGAVVWNAYSGGVRSAEASAAPIVGASGPFKSRPVREAPPEDVAEQAAVFERVERDASRAPVEDRRDIPAPAEAKIDATPADLITSAHVVSERPETPPGKPTDSEGAASSSGETGQTPAQAMARSVTVTPPPSAGEPRPLATPPSTLPTTTALSAASTPELVGGYRPVFAPNGPYLVQMAAPSTETAALTEWDRRAKAAPHLFEGAEKLVIRADVNGKTVYRLRVGAFATPADANAFCDAIKASGGDCYRTAR